ncbi:Holliday junction resolvase RuvX [Alphaproteobacteria bacterium]|jgi:putative Holliday junction resolvase|nr:Holliday junction resolvase RuvX [Alphaproteobacteria bacterium]MDC0967857.1 Holliday junction resolvase RuvX [Alphaproteobacteria bacterium]OUX23049.1 MAG: Holliday junction resolvase RuvX [Pelagibacteraceae bacterium TMED259]|tara:strand:+ start:520 stop:966 length:447 start_codon:yes stop_codon:yes gene_type:complete
MVVDTISDFLVSNNYAKKFLSIDFGLKYIGTAISDTSNIIAKPFGTFTEDEIFKELNNILISENICGLILGKPYHLDGSESEMSRKVIDFSEKIEKITAIPILLLDERLSSKPYKSAKNISKISIHEKSACLILDDFLTLYRNTPSGK